MTKVMFLSFIMYCCISLLGFTYAADKVVVIMNNSNNANNYNGGGSNIMCSKHGGFCVNDGFIMSSSRTIYAPTQWKRPTIRERKLSYEQNKYSSYEY